VAELTGPGSRTRRVQRSGLEEHSKRLVTSNHHISDRFSLLTLRIQTALIQWLDRQDLELGRALYIDWLLQTCHYL